MKAILQKVPGTGNASFAVQEFRSAFFNIPWHFHPEYELVYILESEGTRFVGDKIGNFQPGDLVLIGSNLPHWYRNDQLYYNQEPGLQAASIVIQFRADFLGETFLLSPEMAKIHQVLQKSQRGLEIYGQLNKRVAARMQEIRKLRGMDRLLQLLSILHDIAGSEEYNVLSQKGPSVGINENDPKRINKIYEYVMNHFQEPISIEEASNVIHMCPSTFCRFFKKRTRNTFTYFLNEVRISHACKLLIEEDLSITEICFASGYNNISYFNRQFKAHKHLTPQAFRNEYFKTVSFGSPSLALK